MGSSAKRKKEKKKDFQKTKLKVGKTKSKPANHTSTEFKARSIVLSKQSLSVAAPAVSSQFAHHVTLLRSKTDSQRRDALAFLTSIATNRFPGTDLPEPAVSLLPKLQPLIVDGSHGVRQQLLKLLRCFFVAEIEMKVEHLLLYTRAGLTHLSAEIRAFALEVLDWLLGIVGKAVVACPGGWMKTLHCFMGLLEWESKGPRRLGGWTGTQSTVGRGIGSEKMVAQQMSVLTAFLATGLNDSEGENRKSRDTCFPCVGLRQHLIPQRSKAFAHLNLFGPPQDTEDAICEDRAERQRLLVAHFKVAIVEGLSRVQREGGELGRSASALSQVLQHGLIDYDYE